MTPEELERLSEDQRQDLERRQNQIVQEFRSVMLRQRQLMQQLTAEIREVERNFSAMLIAPLMAELKQRHPQERVQRYLEAVQKICWPTSSGSRKGAHRHLQGRPFYRHPVNASCFSITQSTWSLITVRCGVRR